MRQDVQVYVTIKLKGLGQRFEESDEEGDRQIYGVWCCSLLFKEKCYYDKIYLQLIDRYGRPQITTGQMGFGVVITIKYTYNS